MSQYSANTGKLGSRSSNVRNQQFATVDLLKKMEEMSAAITSKDWMQFARQRNTAAGSPVVAQRFGTGDVQRYASRSPSQPLALQPVASRGGQNDVTPPRMRQRIAVHRTPPPLPPRQVDQAALAQDAEKFFASNEPINVQPPRLMNSRTSISHRADPQLSRAAPVNRSFDQIRDLRTGRQLSPVVAPPPQVAYKNRGGAASVSPFQRAAQVQLTQSPPQIPQNHNDYGYPVHTRPQPQEHISLPRNRSSGTRSYQNFITPIKGKDSIDYSLLKPNEIRQTVDWEINQKRVFKGMGWKDTRGIIA